MCGDTDSQAAPPRISANKQVMNETKTNIKIAFTPINRNFAVQHVRSFPVMLMWKS